MNEYKNLSDKEQKEIDNMIKDFHYNEEKGKENFFKSLNTDYDLDWSYSEKSRKLWSEGLKRWGIIWSHREYELRKK